MKNRIIFIIVLVLSFSFCLKNVSASELCSSNGYTVLTINGIFTTLDGAIYNKDALKFKLKNTYNNQPLSVDFLYNPSHLAGVGDIFDAIQQGLFDQKSDYDLVEMLNDASQKITTQKLLLVAHSQGNFYANSFYDKVASQKGGVPNESIGVYGVATPASRVAGNGKYLTSDTDNVIASTVARFVNILSPNIHIPLQKSDGNGHSFSDVYLKYQGDKIISDIKSTLNQLKENDKQNSGDPCISPPELSVIHKIQGIALAVADPTANMVKGGVVTIYNASTYIANKTRDIGMAIGDNIHNTGLVIGDMFKGLLANVAVGLPDSNKTETLLSNPIPESTLEPVKEPTKKNTTKIITEELPSSVVNIAPESLEPVSVAQQNLYPNFLPSGGGRRSTTVSVVEAVKDITPPIISMVGANSVDVVRGTVYNDAGATANDETDGICAVGMTGSVDSATIGVYTITYTASDLSNNVSTLTRTVNVVADNIAPVITILGNNPEVVIKNSIYNDAGATALDNVDGDVTSSIVKNGTFIDTATSGTYTITYTATDLSQNTTTETRTVIVDDGAKLNRPNFVAVSGDYAYVVSDLSNSLEIIDITNPAVPMHKSSIVSGSNGVNLFSPKAVAVSGDYAYVVSYSNNLNIIDISDPLLPVIKSTLYDENVRLLRPTSIIVSGNYAYILSSGRQSVDIVDIVDPTNPVLKGSYYINSLSSPSSIFISGNYMYLTFIIVGQNGGGLQIVDISNPDLPILQGSISDGTDGATLSYPRSIFVFDSYAYITCWDTKALEIIDISDPINPIHKGKLTEGFGNGDNFTPNYIFVSGNYAFVTSFVGETLEIIDISDPANPIPKGSLANGVGDAALSYPSSVFVSDNYAYVSSFLSNALEVIDISDPANPIHKGKISDGEFSHTL